MAVINKRGLFQLTASFVVVPQQINKDDSEETTKREVTCKFVGDKMSRYFSSMLVPFKLFPQIRWSTIKNNGQI